MSDERCPTCGEPVRGATWHRLRDVPGALPAFRLIHRRAGGARCETVRGAWVAGEGDIRTPGGDRATI